jgi:hypothetical protein
LFVRGAALAPVALVIAACELAKLPAPPLPERVVIEAGPDDTVVDFVVFGNAYVEPIEVCLRSIVIIPDAGRRVECSFEGVVACLVLEPRTTVLDAPFRSGAPCLTASPGSARVLADLVFRRKSEKLDEPWETATLLTAADVIIAR